MTRFRSLRQKNDKGVAGGWYAILRYIPIISATMVMLMLIFLIFNYRRMLGIRDDDYQYLLSSSLNATTANTPTIINAPPTFVNNPFCNSIKPALSSGAPPNRTMIHAFVSNSGHFPFLHNVLLSMIHAKKENNISWKPLILSIGDGVCNMIYNVTELRNYGVVCVPYLDRLFHQLQRDEPESVIQISEKLMGNTTSKDSNSSRFHNIDQTFYGWGSVEHKFLINSKLYALRDILNCGVDAFITDTDIGFKGDPRPYFDVKGANGDVIAQNDTNDNYKLSLNSGFMYWRNTRGNRELIEDIITVPLFWHVDQARVNARMHIRSTPHTLLAVNKFPNGAQLDSIIDNNKIDDCVIFHANWNSKRDEKVDMLKKMGLWFLPPNSDSDDGYR